MKSPAPSSFRIEIIPHPSTSPALDLIPHVGWSFPEIPGSTGSFGIDPQWVLEVKQDNKTVYWVAIVFVPDVITTAAYRDDGTRVPYGEIYDRPEILSLVEAFQDTTYRRMFPESESPFLEIPSEGDLEDPAENEVSQDLPEG